MAASMGAMSVKALFVGSDRRLRMVWPGVVRPFLCLEAVSWGRVRVSVRSGVGFGSSGCGVVQIANLGVSAGGRLMGVGS